jgi:hypothetical protein
LVATPQFLLGGVDAPDRQTVPSLTAAASTRAAQCARIAAMTSAAQLPWQLLCDTSAGVRVDWRAVRP